VKGGPPHDLMECASLVQILKNVDSAGAGLNS